MLRGYRKPVRTMSPLKCYLRGLLCGNTKNLVKNSIFTVYFCSWCHSSLEGSHFLRLQCVPDSPRIVEGTIRLLQHRLMWCPWGLGWSDDAKWWNLTCEVSQMAAVMHTNSSWRDAQSWRLFRPNSAQHTVPVPKVSVAPRKTTINVNSCVLSSHSQLNPSSIISLAVAPRDLACEIFHIGAH